MIRGGWNGNLSLSKISKLKVSIVFCSIDSAVLAISSWKEITRSRVNLTKLLTYLKSTYIDDST